MLKSLGLHFFQNGTPIFQMGLLFLEKEESRTPSEIQVRTLSFSNLQISRTGIKSWTGSNIGHIAQLILELLALGMLKKPIIDLVRGIVPSHLFATSSNMQVSRTGIKFWTSSNFGQYV